MDNHENGHGKDNGNGSAARNGLLSRLNEREVFHAIQSHGPMSRAAVARRSGVSVPTAIKAVDSLLRAGLLEERDATSPARGRPARIVRVASNSAQVVGLVIDAPACRAVTAGLDGVIHDVHSQEFRTPASYDALLDSAAAAILELMNLSSATILGVGISVPGLFDYRSQLGVFSPNVPITDGRSPARDLSVKLGLECIALQEADALCLAERQFGLAQGLQDFAMVDASTGVGAGIISGGRLLSGHRGFAGEIGHITVDPFGRPCGCGNRGCLETLASDSAFAHMISQRVGYRVDVEEAISLVAAGRVDAADDIGQVCRYLAIGLAAVINLFNPSTLFVHGQVLASDPDLFSRVIGETRSRALKPSFQDCRIVLSRGSKRQGAVAAIIDHVASSLAPEFVRDIHCRPVMDTDRKQTASC